MSIYEHIQEAWKKPKEGLGDLWQERLIAWRSDEVTTRIERPTRLDRARALGYKPKQGILIIRQRVERGGRQREQIRHPRRPKHNARRKDLSQTYQWVAELRVQKKYPNCEVLNSYYVAHDGNHLWYEVILLDRAHPAIANDSRYKGVIEQKGRVYRGLTSSSRKSRGLLNKGKGAEKFRPSRTANLKRRKKYTNMDRPTASYR